MTSKLGRRAGAMLIGACLAFAAGVAPAAAQEELRIGLIAPMTGPFAQVGADMTNGFKMYLDEVGSNFAGAKVNLIIEDSQGKPDTAVTKAKKLILEDHVQLLVGGVLAPEGYALAPVSTAEKTVYIASVPAADDLTQRQLGNYPYFIRTSWTSSQPHHPLGQWACDQGYKKIITVGADYAFGYEAVGGFQKGVEDSGGLQTPRNESFVKAYRAKYGKVPSYFSESNYTTAMMIDMVMKQTKGAWPGPEAFIAKMLTLKVDAPRGPVSFDDMRNPIQDIYIKKVEKTKMFGYDKNELWNVVIKTYPAVSQFWTYGKDAFLKQPVYSRDFPPCKYCE